MRHKLKNSGDILHNHDSICLPCINVITHVFECFVISIHVVWVISRAGLETAEALNARGKATAFHKTHSRSQGVFFESAKGCARAAECCAGPPMYRSYLGSVMLSVAGLHRSNCLKQ